MTRFQPITVDEAIKELKELQSCGDVEIAHSRADDILCRVLCSLGQDYVVEEWDKVEKWYA